MLPMICGGAGRKRISSTGGYLSSSRPHIKLLTSNSRSTFSCVTCRSRKLLYLLFFVCSFLWFPGRVKEFLAKSESIKKSASEDDMAKIMPAAVTATPVFPSVSWRMVETGGAACPEFTFFYHGSPVCRPGASGRTKG